MVDNVLPGTFRRFTHNAFSQGTHSYQRMTENESVAVTCVEDNGTELLRAGMGFAGGCQVIASGIAPDATLPTTTAKLVLYNSASAGGASLVIKQISFALGSGTAAAGAALYLGLPQAVIATPPTMASNYAAVSASCSGTTSKAVWGTAVTMPASTKWFVADANSGLLAAANVGQGNLATDLTGCIIIPPLYGLGIAIFSAAGTTPLYSVGAVWREIVLDLQS